MALRLRLAALLGAFALLATAPGCNLIDIALGRHAHISRMVPGTSVTSGQLDCWLTLEFKRYPEDVDLRDVRVRFESIALAGPAEFDWHFIATHDKLAKGHAFGSGYREAEMTSPAKPPPLGQPTKVRFPLQAKSVIEDAPRILYLEAELYWGGKKQDSVRHTIEHAYATEPNSFF